MMTDGRTIVAQAIHTMAGVEEAFGPEAAEAYADKAIFTGLALVMELRGATPRAKELRARYMNSLNS